MPARFHWPRRDPRLARLPLLLAYLLVLLGTPYGEAGFLWMHLATAHSAPPAEVDAEKGHPAASRTGGGAALPGPEHEHSAPHDHETAGAHAHGHTVAHEHAEERAPRHGDTHVDARTPEHHRPVAGTGEPERRSAAPGEPHEHGGRVHTHRQHPAPDAEPPAASLSKYYLSPPTTPAPAASADPRHAAQIPPPPHQVAARIDTPPPRRPG